MADNLRPTRAKTITPFKTDTPDDVFICAAGFEERCLGISNKLQGYQPNHAYIIAYERDEVGRKNATVIRKQFKNSRIVISSGTDPVSSLAGLTNELRGLRLTPRKSVITIDMTVLTKRHILLLLRILDNLQLFECVRILYTEPKNYVANLYLPMSSGIKQIDVIPGFVSIQPLSRPLLLVIMLGYEGDRAMALFNHLDPNEALLIVPKPAYHDEWEGRTEAMNRNLITMLGEEKVRYAHSLDPYKVANSLTSILNETDSLNVENSTCCISPLGTKPQTLGLYLYWRQNPFKVSIVYAEPLEYNQKFYSSGVGDTWTLIRPNSVS